MIVNGMPAAGGVPKILYSQICELRPPKGLGIGGINSQVVSIARFGSMQSALNGTEIACP